MRLFYFCRKVVYPNEYMIDWKKFSEMSLPEKKDFYSHLNMEETTDPDYRHRKIIYKEFKIQGKIMISMFKVVKFCQQM